MKIELNSKVENPFYGLKNCLNLFQGSANAINVSLLNSAYNEVKDEYNYSNGYYFFHPLII